MTKRIKQCDRCKKYTISTELCPLCQGKLNNINPPRFSLQDKYQKYRLDYFQEKMESKFPGLSIVPPSK